jgi:hypothetical protein
VGPTEDKCGVTPCRRATAGGQQVGRPDRPRSQISGCILKTSRAPLKKSAKPAELTSVYVRGAC